MEKCELGCPDKELCQRLKKHINGRLWDIWNGVNISPNLAKKYRELWEKEAGLAPPQPTFQAAQQNTQQTTTPKKKGGCNCGRKKS